MLFLKVLKIRIKYFEKKFFLKVGNRNTSHVCMYKLIYSKSYDTYAWYYLSLNNFICFWCIFEAFFGLLKFQKRFENTRNM